MSMRLMLGHAFPIPLKHIQLRPFYITNSGGSCIRFLIRSIIEKTSTSTC